MDIQKLIQLPYSDFKLNTPIDPEQFDINNQTMVDKIDEMVDVTNQSKKDSADALAAANNAVVKANDNKDYIDKVAKDFLLGALQPEIIGENTVFVDQNAPTTKFKMIVVDGRPFLEVISI